MTLSLFFAESLFQIDVTELGKLEEKDQPGAKVHANDAIYTMEAQKQDTPFDYFKLVHNWPPMGLYFMLFYQLYFIWFDWKNM